MVNRPSERAAAALKTVKLINQDVQSVDCDLLDFNSVREAGKKLRSMFKEDGIDVLCNNAGIMGFPGLI